MRIQDNLMEEEILGGEYREVVLDKKPDFRYYNKYISKGKAI